MKQWILQYWVEKLFAAITIVFIALYRNLSKKIQNKFKEQDAIKLGIQALLRGNIIQNYNHYMEKGFYPIYARENMEALYTQYRALGGNGVVTGLLDKLKDLPTEL